MSSRACAARGAELRARRAGCGGRFAASMTLEILHGALVLLGRRARLVRAEITAAAGLRVDLARIEAIAARAELADHRRLPRAACARRMLCFAARLCALLATVTSVDGFDADQPQGTGESSVASRMRFHRVTHNRAVRSASAPLAANHNR